MEIDISNLIGIDTQLELPSTSLNLTKQLSEENKWGDILNNKTFYTLNNNIKILKSSLIETVNIINQGDIVAKNKNIQENDTVITLGDNTKKLNFSTTQIQLNGIDTEFLTLDSLDNVQNIAYLDKINNFTQPINTTQYKLNNNSIISDDNININLGSNERKLNLHSNDGKLYINNNEFKVQNNSENKFYDYEELKKYDERISNFLNDCIMFIQGKIGVISGYFKNNVSIFEQLNSDIEMFKVPIKIKHYNKINNYSDIWFNENMSIRTYSDWDYSVIKMGEYFNLNKKFQPFHFQGMFYID